MRAVEQLEQATGEGVASDFVIGEGAIGQLARAVLEPREQRGLGGIERQRRRLEGTSGRQLERRERVERNHVGVDQRGELDEQLGGDLSERASGAGEHAAREVIEVLARDPLGIGVGERAERVDPILKYFLVLNPL